MPATDLDAPRLAIDLLAAALAGEPVEDLVREIARLERGFLRASLTDDDARRAFWLNLYNAWIQVRIAQEPAAYGNRLRFFAARAIPVAGTRLSLNAIEHGILRRSQLSIGFGYVRNPLPSTFERALRVDRLDPRIHFALNCGARSCPPIGVYRPEIVDSQLELATAGYLGSEVTFDPQHEVAAVPRLFRWYRGDFGGHDGIVALLERHGRIPAGVRPRLRYGAYDWTMTPAGAGTEGVAADVFPLGGLRGNRPEPPNPNG